MRQVCLNQLCLKRCAITGIAAASVLLAASCGVDLGKCDMTQLGGDMLTATAYTGQQLVQNNCASGRCHSEGAQGSLRVGAPAGLNFDVVPGANTPDEQAKAGRGDAKVKEKADLMWSLIDGGNMPPPGRGTTLSSTDKESIRNWLACSAPIINAANTTATADWDSIYGVLATSGTCSACHGSGTSAAGMGFSLGDDACSAYNAVVNKPSITPTCMGKGLTLVVPSQPASSFLLQKVKGMQTCGSSMPLGAMPLAVTNADVVQKLEQWITNGALKPATCP